MIFLYRNWVSVSCSGSEIWMCFPNSKGFSSATASLWSHGWALLDSLSFHRCFKNAKRFHYISLWGLRPLRQLVQSALDSKWIEVLSQPFPCLRFTPRISRKTPALAWGLNYTTTKWNTNHATVTVCVCFCGCFSFQCESSQLPSPVWLREGVQPSMRMHLRPHPWVRLPTDAVQRVNTEELFVFIMCFPPRCVRVQGAQQHPGVHVLPDGSGGTPAPLGGRLVLPLKHGRVLRQLDQGCQISQGPLTLSRKRLATRVPPMCVCSTTRHLIHFEIDTVLLTVS